MGSPGKRVPPVLFAQPTFFTHEALFTQRIDGINHFIRYNSVIGYNSVISVMITTSFPLKHPPSFPPIPPTVIPAKENPVTSLPGADLATKVTPPGIVMVCLSCLSGPFPLLETVSPSTVTFPGFPRE